MKKLKIPAPLPFWEIGHFSIDRETLRERLGAPHFTETDSSRTFGGEEDSWAYSTDSGLRVVITLRVPYREAVIYSDPPNAEEAAKAFSCAIGEAKVIFLEIPHLQI